MSEIFEYDNRISSVNLSNGNSLSLDYYTQIQYIHHPNTGEYHYSLISVKSDIEGYLLIFIDKEEIGKVFIGKGVQNIPYNINIKKYVSFYFRPDESYGDEILSSESIQLKVL